MRMLFLSCLCPSLLCPSALTGQGQDPDAKTKKIIWLWPGLPPRSAPEDDFRPWLEPYLVTSKEPVGAVLVLPGGGYAGRAPHEAGPIAERVNQAGLHAFVLQYRVSPNRHPAPLMDAMRAIRIIGSRAQDWGIKPDHIAILGFSAGGHLAASLGVHFDRGDPEAKDPLDRLTSRPDALILCYPVISSGPFGHRGSVENLLGPTPSEEMLRTVSLETQVTPQTPPTFLWHTANDDGVPVANSLLFAQALSQCKVPFELHVYPNGRHGLGLAEEDPHVATWMDLCVQWLKGMGW